MLVDIDRDQFGGLSAERFFGWVTRLAAYDGAVAARIYHLQEEEKKRNPSHEAIKQGATVVDSAAAIAAAYPGVVEIVRV